MNRRRLIIGICVIYAIPAVFVLYLLKIGVIDHHQLGLWSILLIGILTIISVVVSEFQAHRRSKMPPGRLQSSTGLVVRKLTPKGVIKLGSERWNAATKHKGVLEAGTEVKVVGMNGLEVIVEPVEVNSE